MFSAKIKASLLMLVIPLLLIACGDDKETDADNAPSVSNTALPYSEAMIETGATTYGTFCIACHGAGAKGYAGLGPDLTASAFVKSKTDAELVAFVHEGRSVDHPDNTTGVVMPPNGGFPNLTDEQILSIIAYVRSQK